jgi:hypothetical protein
LCFDRTARTKEFDRERILQLVNKQEWQHIIEEFKDDNNYNAINADTILKPLIDQYFIHELLTKSSLNADPAYKYYLEQFHGLHESRNFKFKLSDEDYKKLIVRIVEVENDLAYAYKYATKFPEEEICKQVIKQYQDELPKVVRHSQESEIYVTENKNIQDFDASTGLFKSQQEYQFYKAVREVFQMFLVIPNVALNAVLSFDIIKNKLSVEERKYFFGALIDCVVIDTENNYKPIKFVELDSPYHDTEKQIQKDKLKDNILATAGQKLVRIRRTTYKEDEKDFIKLIRETIK